ncbi:hypothetical protein B0I35DRAFT_147646 [Stachybotrys elegans]|uniref:Rhodopsin domain-containing protein n=1 Tax=Stachybotrys elegans TaxID=80388 RepID=A0A8K0SIJ8_9HYPO|nr:hypothetical protein B0I35DRAFT_147646 [Stachybotrys elegans]
MTLRPLPQGPPHSLGTLLTPSNQVFWLVCLGLAIPLCLNGLGARSAHVTPEMEVQTRKYFFLFQDMYVWANIPAKTSICLSIRRVVKHYTWITWTLYAIIFVIASSSIVTNIWLLTFCRPVAAMWDPTIPGSTCRPASAMVAIANAWSYINIIIDWIVALLPVFLLWKINMPWKQKATVSGVLSLGIFASSATLVRLVYLPAFTATHDYLYGLGQIILWTILELTMAIIAVSLMALRPLLRRFLGSSASENVDAAARPAPDTRQRNNRFFRMHGWSLQIGLDSYLNAHLTRQSTLPTGTSNGQTSFGDMDITQSPRSLPG